MEFLVSMVESYGRQSAHASVEPGGTSRAGCFRDTLPLPFKFEQILFVCLTLSLHAQRRQHGTGVLETIVGSIVCVGTVLRCSVVLLAVLLIECHPANAVPAFAPKYGIPCSSNSGAGIEP